MTLDEYQGTIAQRFRTLLTKFDREMLTRYYLDAKSPEQICRELDISLEEFRERKVRAKAILTRGISLRRRAATVPADGAAKATLSADPTSVAPAPPR